MRVKVKRWLGIVAVLVLFLSSALLPTLVIKSASATSAKASRKTTIDCADCHVCKLPTHVTPCLKPNICPRHQAEKGLSPDLGPDVVILDKLEDLYGPVHFNHKLHATMSELSGGCETCHHYTPPNEPNSACKDCHPVKTLHEQTTQPGLKGAYHRLCLKCHKEWDKNTSCEVCHVKKTGATAENTTIASIHGHSHYKEVKLQDLMVFKTNHNGGDQVPFHHKRHSQVYERNCVQCHQNESCTQCHSQESTELHPIEQPGEGNLHDTCFKCHDSNKCSVCHGRDPNDLFNHADTGWPLKSYHAKLDCQACHASKRQMHKLNTACSSCHPKGWTPDTFNHAKVTGVALGETHGQLDCENCHVNGVGSKPQCDACHDDGRTYDPAKGFPKD